MTKPKLQQVGWIGWHTDEHPYENEPLEFFQWLPEKGGADTWRQVPIYVEAGTLDEHPTWRSAPTQVLADFIEDA